MTTEREREFLESHIEEVEDQEAFVHCITCGYVFLKISLREYLKYHVWGEPDRWFVETGIHWCENPGHEIVAELPSPTSITKMWEKRMSQDGSTREAMMPYFLKYREQAKEKPI